LQFAPKHPVPIFPLPGAVLFPRVLLPLHVFELRYRTLVRESLSGERLIGLALLKPGWENDYHGSPPFHPVGCLARFEEVEWLPNDCYNLKVFGVARVRFGRVVREYPYRAAVVNLLPEEPLSDDDPLTELERRALLDAHMRLLRSMAPPGTEVPPLDGATSLESLVNTACMSLIGDARIKHDLLSMDSVLERSRRVRALIEDHLRVRTKRPADPGDRN
jgi:Lon protease-like protein